MVSKGGVTRTYGACNKLTSDSTWTYSYDVNGNVAHKTKTGETWDYSFNSLDQLTAVVKSGTTLGQYKYDANGMRANTTVGTTPTYTDFVYLGHDPLYEKNMGTGIFTDYVYVNGRTKAKLVGTVSTDIYYYISDALGSTRLVWKHGATSATFSVATYAPFGTPAGASGTERVEYAGEMRDSATGLYYVFARYMDPELGRFISLNPQLGSLSSPQTMNRYVYCVNNPDSLATSELIDEGVRHLRDRALHIRSNVRREDRPPLEMDPTS